MTEQKAKLKYLRISPRKVRLLADLIRGLSVNEAEMELTSNTQRSTKPLLKLLHSAVANVKDKGEMNPDHLFIKSITVDQGPMMKRYMPRARGSASMIQKKSSHITLILSADEKIKSKFNFIKKTKVKTEKPTKESKKETRQKTSDTAKVSGSTAKPEVESSKDVARDTNKKGVLKKFFRRKSI